MARTESQICRILTLIPYIVKHQPVTISEVCEVFQMSRDELLDDLKLIWFCGQPDYTPADLIDVNIEGENIYIHMADYFSRPLRFTPYDLAALYLAGNALSELMGLSEATVLKSALEKIERAIQRPNLSYSDVAEKKVALHSEHPDQPKLRILRKAIEGRRIVEMDYYSSRSDTISKRMLNPCKLYFSYGNWYVYGWDHKSKEWRLFRVDRIKEIKALKERYDPALLKEMEEAKDAVPVLGVFKGKKVKLRFDSSLANWALEQNIFSEKEPHEDGSLTCTLYTENFAWLEKEILRYGSSVQILEPPELREAVLRRLDRMLQLYQKNKP